nr:ADP-ribosylation factor-like protein 8B [Parasteatoda tepidariorum]
MFEFIWRLWEWLIGLFWQTEMEVSVVGLHKAGKTTYVNLISKIDCTNTIPTVGFNMRKIRCGNTSIKVWDLGGERRFRGMWERYCRGVNAILFMVDAADGEKIFEARHELHELLRKPQLTCVPILILGNKTDLPHAFSQAELIDHLNLKSIENREVSCFMVSCKYRENIDITLQWLIAHSKRPK